jgi:Fe2+ transport system protein B
MENGEDAPLTLGIFDKYVMRLEKNMATKADVKDLKAELKADVKDLKAELKADVKDLKAELKADVGDVKARIDRVESGTWTRLDRMEENMATKADMTSVKEDTVRIREAMAEDDTDMAKTKRRLDEMEGAR